MLKSTGVKNSHAGSKVAKEFARSVKDVVVERVIIVNANKGWEGKRQVDVEEGGKGRKVDVEFVGEKDGAAAWVVVKNARVRIGEDWSIRFKSGGGREL